MILTLARERGEILLLGEKKIAFDLWLLVWLGSFWVGSGEDRCWLLELCVRALGFLRVEKAVSHGHFLVMGKCAFYSAVSG